MVMVSAEEDNSTFTVSIDGPSKIGIDEKHMYKITASSGKNDTNASYTWSPKLSGRVASEVTLFPGSGINSNGTFYFNLTAPTKAGEFTLTISVLWKNDTTNMTQETEVKVEVVNPIVLTAAVHNAANLTADDVMVAFYLYDDPDNKVMLYNTTVTLDANATEVLVYNWTDYDISAGKHTFLVQVDPDQEFVTLANGNSSLEMTIYYDVAGYGMVNTLLWVLIIAILVILYLVYRRPVKSRKKIKRQKKRGERKKGEK